jgi:hypothetical protein
MVRERFDFRKSTENRFKNSRSLLGWGYSYMTLSNVPNIGQTNFVHIQVITYIKKNKIWRTIQKLQHTLLIEWTFKKWLD